MTTSLRGGVYNVLAADYQMNSLGISLDSLYPAGSENTIPQTTFVVMRWGITEPGPGRDSDVRVEDLNLWAYDRDANYDRVTAILRRARTVLEGMPATRAGMDAGWVIGVTWQGDSTDLFDDGYGSWGRNSAYRIAATGGW